MRPMLDFQYEILDAVVRCKNHERGMWYSQFYRLCQKHLISPQNAIKGLSTLIYLDQRSPRNSVGLISRRRALIALANKRIPERSDLV